MLKKCFALLFLFCIAAFGEPDFPQLSGRVVDEIGLLSKERQTTLSQKLEAIETNSSAQVVVAIVKTLHGHDIADYGYRLGRHWGIGQKGTNNGVILIVAPHEKKIRIEVGYGLEDRLTDAKAHQIINDVILTRFKDKDVFGGLDAGVSEIAVAINATVQAKSVKQDDNTSKHRSLSALYTAAAMIFVPLLFFVLWATKTLIQSKRARKIINGILASSIAAVVTWILFFMLGVSIVAAVIFFIIGFLIDDKQKSDTTFGLFAAAVAVLTLPQAAFITGVLELLDVVKVQIIAFMLFVMLAYLPQINILFAPKKTKERRAKVLAQSGFFRVGLHGTTHRHSLMLFVSLDEKYVEILADADIIDKLSLSAFEAIKSELANAVGKKEFADAYISTIKMCGAMLAEKFPSDGSRANELIDGVVELNE